MSVKKHLYTTTELFNLIMQQLREEGRIPENLEYVLATNEDLQMRDYEFDIIGSTSYGASEGIYVTLFCRGNIGWGWGKTYPLGTIKTLQTDDDSFRRMAVLMADFQIAAHRFVNGHLDDFTWTGYDIDYYRAEETERDYGVTMKGVASFDKAEEEARRVMKRYIQYVKAVITRNTDGKTKTVWCNKNLLCPNCENGDCQLTPEPNPCMGTEAERAECAYV